MVYRTGKALWHAITARKTVTILLILWCFTSAETMSIVAAKICEDGCDFDCAQHNGEEFGDHEDCTKYYECWNDEALHRDCPAGLVYDCRSKSCKWDWESMCQPPCPTEQSITTTENELTNLPSTESEVISSTTTTSSSPSTTTSSTTTTTTATTTTTMTSTDDTSSSSPTSPTTVSPTTTSQTLTSPTSTSPASTSSASTSPISTSTISTSPPSPLTSTISTSSFPETTKVDSSTVSASLSSPQPTETGGDDTSDQTWLWILLACVGIITVFLLCVAICVHRKNRYVGIVY